jgi:GNAT superfamily N-acetyltransferase
VSPGLDVRPYRPADRERVLALHERAIRAAGTPPEKLPDTSDLDDIEAAYPDAGGAFLVGEFKGEIVAIGGLVPVADVPDEPGRTAELKRMRVAPDHQGRGFGGALLGALEDAARDRSFDQLVLDTAERQGSAPFYRSRGYRETGRRQWREFELIAFEKRL